MTADDGNSNFWPGYVDAISNLVLNLLFVVAILTIAVFLFAIELGRKQVSLIDAASREGAVPSKAAESKETLRKENDRLEIELSNLRKELVRLQNAGGQSAGGGSRPAKDNGKDPVQCVPPATESSAAVPAGGARGGDSRLPPKRVEVTAKTPEPEKELDSIYAGSPIVIDFSADSVTLSKAEAEEARRALGPVAGSGGARLEVVVKGSFTETRRLAFYRTMAVRNLLIEMGLPVDKIDVSIREVKNGGDSTKVLVRGLR